MIRLRARQEFPWKIKYKLIHDIQRVDDQRERYRVSLVPVQKLRLLDENSAVSWKARGIRNWTIDRNQDHVPSNIKLCITKIKTEKSMSL